VTRHASTSKGLGIEDEELVAVIGSHAYFINSDSAEESDLDILAEEPKFEIFVEEVTPPAKKRKTMLNKNQRCKMMKQKARKKYTKNIRRQTY
jgi:proteasome assembly chaperone (PAC2) family protein